MLDSKRQGGNMSLSEAQKAKLIFLLRLLREKTDRNHGITVKDIANELAQWDIHVERKSLYRGQV